MQDQRTETRVAIIGAGVGGIAAAIALQRQLGFTNFVVYEKASEIGGTWRDNIYPGCECDVQSHFYSLSTDLNPNWSHHWSSQEEILEYWKGLVIKHGLTSRICFNTSVQSCLWDEDRQLYHLNLRDAKTGEVSGSTAHVLINAAGVVRIPKYPSIPGLDTFKGESFHSAKWDYNVKLAGKRVAIIGNGCSAAQFVPAISEDATTVITNFCRTPQWYAVKAQSAIPEWMKRVFRTSPLALRLYRIWRFITSDLIYVIFYKRDGLVQQGVRKDFTSYIERMAPKEYLPDLIPKYPIGCKRLVVDPGYLEALHRPNLTLEYDHIVEVVEDGLITKSGKKYQSDVIIYGTGFELGMQEHGIQGLCGETVEEYFQRKQVPTAYYGTCMPFAPNYFTIFGPNTGVAHTSGIFTAEVQINYAIQFIQPIIEGIVKSFCPREDATDRYNDFIQRKLKTSIWAGCQSSYRAGENLDGKVHVLFPGPASLFWWWLRNPVWADFNVVGGEKWAAQRRRRRGIQVVLVALFALAVVRWDLIQANASVLLSTVLSWIL